jgi:hypothetical protein
LPRAGQDGVMGGNHIATDRHQSHSCAIEPHASASAIE